jgi:chromosome segregation ATPase
MRGALSEELGSERAKNGELYSMLESLNAEIGRQNHIIQQKNAEFAQIDSFKAELEKRREEVSRRIHEKNEAERLAAVLKNEIEQQKAEIQRQSQMLANGGGGGVEAERLRAELETNRSQVETLRADLRRQTELAASGAGSATEVRFLKEEVERLKGELMQRKSEIERYRQEIASGAGSNMSVSLEMERMRVEVEDLRGEVRTRKKEIERLREELDQKSEQLKSKSGNTAELQVEVERLQNEFTRRKSDLEAEVNRLQDELNRRKSDLETQVNWLQDELNRRKTEAESYREELQKQKERVAAEAKAAASLGAERELEQLKAELARQRLEAERIHQGGGAAPAQLQEADALRQELAAYKAELERYRAEMNNAAPPAASENSGYAELSRELERQREQINYMGRLLENKDEEIRAIERHGGGENLQRRKDEVDKATQYVGDLMLRAKMDAERILDDANIQARQMIEDASGSLGGVYDQFARFHHDIEFLKGRMDEAISAMHHKAPPGENHNGRNGGFYRPGRTPAPPPNPARPPMPPPNGRERSFFRGPAGNERRYRP